jgi:uncharacterized membrane protein YjjP (DUF1212 family)
MGKVKIFVDNKEEILNLVMKAGEILLCNGAEIFRVEETITIMAKAYGATHVDAYVVSNGIFVTLNMGESYLYTQIKSLPANTVHLGRVAAVNNLSRNIVAGKYTIEAAYQELDKIAEIPFAPDYLRILCAGIGSAGFGYLLGSTVYDSGVSFVSGLLLYLFIIYAEKRSLPKVLKNVIGSAVVTLVSSILFHLGFGNSLDHIIIGSIICMVPGVAFTTSVRDFFNGDYLSGTIHLVDTLLVATSISVGVSVVLKVCNMFF